MKFSIANLERARRNPVEFAKILKNGDSSANKFGGYPKSMRWLDAVCEFHRSGDISDAFDALEKALGGRKPTAQHRRELQALLKSLDNYKNEVTSRRLSFIKSREKIHLRVNEAVEINGIVPLIFMKTAGGFSAYFVSLNNPAWKSELKFPIVQSYVSESVFKSSVEETDVGYIDYLTGEFNELSFSTSEIAASAVELETIGQTILLNY